VLLTLVALGPEPAGQVQLLQEHLEVLAAREPNGTPHTVRAAAQALTQAPRIALKPRTVAGFTEAAAAVVSIAEVPVVRMLLPHQARVPKALLF
jgi:N-acyl-D-aspartate/D-glutamate deacylase